MNKEKGAITVAILIAMLIFSLYGVLFYGNSASAYIRQTRAIESIQKSYSKDVENVHQIVETL